jgi:hypothetical protein
MLEIALSNGIKRSVVFQPEARGRSALLGSHKLLLACFLGLLLFAAGALAQTTAFTFQGRLNDSGIPANGNYDIQLELFDTATPGTGTQIGSTITLPGVKVTSGVFTVQLDFTAAAFSGADRFLEVGVTPAGSGNPLTILDPRQPITPTPYALYSANATTATTATNATNAVNATTATNATNAVNATNATNATTATNSTELNGIAASQYVLTTDSRLTNARPPTAGSANYIQNTTSAQAGGNFNISGNGTVGGALIANTEIGIGTNAPLAPLDVRGNVFIGLTSDPGNVGANALFIANDGGGDSHNSFRLDGATNNLYIIGRSSAGAATGAGIIFRTATQGLGEADRVIIDSSGKVGIGTDSPQATLHVFTSIAGGIGINTFGGNFNDCCNGGSSEGTGLHADGGDNAASSGGGGPGITALGGASPNGIAGGEGVIGTGGTGKGFGGDGIAGFAGGTDSESVGGFFSGGVRITGNLDATGSKNFKIDHPLDPQNKYLRHAAMESSEVLNVYSGNVVADQNGQAVVRFPDWFQAINRDFRYQLTAVGGPAQGLYIAEEIYNNQFKIAGGVPGVKISWQVTGVRSDAGMLRTPFKLEEDKPDFERGSYLDPQAFGQPEEKGEEWARRPQLMREMKERRIKAEEAQPKEQK